MENKIKTYQDWQNNSTGDLRQYLGQKPCEIDEELFFYLAEVVPPQYSGGDFLQTGESSFEEYGVDYYSTCSNFDGKYYFLGVLPEFKQ